MVREGLEPKETTIPQMTGCESLLVKWGLGRQLGVLVVYLAPRYATTALPELLEVIAEAAVETPRLVVMGDFNLPSVGETSGAAREFMASMTAMDLTQVVLGPTHEGGRTLDLIFVSGQWSRDLGTGDLAITPLSWTDHALLRLDFPIAAPHRREAEPNIPIWFRPRLLMDPIRFQRELGPIPVDLPRDST